MEHGWQAVLEQHEVPVTPSFQLSACLADVPQLEHWRETHLPQSRTAIENALVMQHCKRWVLLIDPQVCGMCVFKRVCRCCVQAWETVCRCGVHFKRWVLLKPAGVDGVGG